MTSTNVICLHVKHVENSILENSQITLDSDRIIINLMTESLREQNLAYNIHMNIFIVMAIMVSLRILQ